MSVLTFHSDDYQKFPSILKDYASYMAAIRGNSEKTICEYLLDLRTFFRYLKAGGLQSSLSAEEKEKLSISDIDLSFVQNISTSNIIEFLMYTATERNNSTTTRMRKLSALRSFFGYLFGKKHLISNDPTANIEGPKPKKTLPKYLSYDECIALLETIREDTYSKTVTRDYAIVTMFLNTGMRVSELVGLNINDFDSDLSKVKVLGKGNKERMIYLNNAVIEALQEYLPIRLSPPCDKAKTNALFLSNRENRISVKTVQWMVYKYLDLAGLGNRGLSVHKLRHTAATLMYQSGKVDVLVLKDILGHEQLNTTQIYTHLVNKNIEDAVNNNPLANIKKK